METEQVLAAASRRRGPLGPLLAATEHHGLRWHLCQDVGAASSAPPAPQPWCSPAALHGLWGDPSSLGRRRAGCGPSARLLQELK